MSDSLPAIDERTVPRLLARVAPERTLLLFGDGVWTYGDADRLAGAAAALLESGGVGPGDQVALLLDNSPDYVWLLLGLARLGAIGVTLNTEARGKLLEYFLTDSGARFCIVDVRHYDTLRATGVAFERLWVREGPGLVTGSEQAGSRELARPRDPWLFVYTSGTTGRSKAVIAPHAQAVTTGLVVAGQAGLTPDDRLYTCLPFFHVNAIWYTLLAAASVGASVALAERFSASRFWSDVARYGCTEINAMGSMMQILEQQPVGDAERASRLRTAFVVPFPADPLAFERRFGARLMTTYALSESVPVSLSRPGEGYERGRHAGPILPGSEVRIVDDDDNELPAGAVGEITVRGREPWTMFLGYHGKPAETAEAWRNLWFHTGDLGHVSTDGWLWFDGRKKDAIRRRGENISAFELEEILASHEAIAEVAAIPVPSLLTEDDVCVYVVLQPAAAGPCGPAEIHAYAREHLPRYMVPRYIAIVAALPKTPTSKVEKYRLLERAKAELAALWDAERDAGGERAAAPAS